MFGIVVGIVGIVVTIISIIVTVISIIQSTKKTNDKHQKSNRPATVQMSENKWKKER